MAHIGIERLRPGHRQHHRAEREERRVPVEGLLAVAQRVVGVRVELARPPRVPVEDDRGARGLLLAARDGREVATLSLLSPNEEVAVSVLEQCARPLTAAAPDLTSGITPPQPMPQPTPVPAQGGVLPASAPCKGPQLKMAAEDGDAGAGNRVRNFSLQNVGASACTLTGYPGVTLLDGRGRAVTSVRADQSPGSYFRQGQAPTPVDLAPQAKAYFEVAWNVVPNEAAGQKTCPEVAPLRATAPGDSAAISLAFAFQPCGGKIRVSPIRSASAVQPAT